jgi:hypothetical protein
LKKIKLIDYQYFLLTFNLARFTGDYIIFTGKNNKFTGKNNKFTGCLLDAKIKYVLFK